MMTTEELQARAKNVRKNIIRMLGEAGSGHPGGSLSIADILVTLYFEEMNIDPAQPKQPDRDRFVLSKGHSAPALYATLAERGFSRRRNCCGSARQEHCCRAIPI